MLGLYKGCINGRFIRRCINFGHNKELLEQCRVLKEYAQFVETARQYSFTGTNMQGALNTAIEYCIEHDILKDFLKEYRAEVLGMLLREFDKKKYERSIRNEGREEGIEIGLERGRKQQQETTIKRLRSKGMSEDEIADLLEISVEQVKEVSQRYN